MISKVWIALAIGAAVLATGLTAVAAAGTSSGDCDQTRDRLQDGSCDDCPCDTLEDDTCDSCSDYDWDFLYGETELEPPHQSACGQE